MSTPRKRQYEIVLPMENKDLFEFQKQNIIENFRCLYATHDKDWH